MAAVRSVARRFLAWRRHLPLLALLAAMAAPAAPADSELQAKVEAAYLFNLTKFVEWPALPPNEVRICVLGADAVGSMVTGLSGRPVRDRPLKIEVDSVADPTACQILFIGRGEARLPEILQRVRGAAVLTVSDAEDFARRGGMVGFYADGGRIKLEINPDTARAANLRLSAKLLEVARTVTKP